MIPRVGHKFNMKKVFIVANWKSNKTILQTEEWFQAINNSPVTFNQEKKEVIVCSPFTLLPKVKELIVNCQLLLGRKIFLRLGREHIRERSMEDKLKN